MLGGWMAAALVASVLIALALFIAARNGHLAPVSLQILSDEESLEMIAARFPDAADLPSSLLGGETQLGRGWRRTTIATPYGPSPGHYLERWEIGWPAIAFTGEAARDGYLLRTTGWLGRSSDDELPVETWLVYGPAPGLALNTLLLAAIGLSTHLFWRRGVNLHRYRAGRCIRCGYDLRGHPDRSCPECGHTADVR